MRSGLNLFANTAQHSGILLLVSYRPLACTVLRAFGVLAKHNTRSGDPSPISPVWQGSKTVPGRNDKNAPSRPDATALLPRRAHAVDPPCWNKGQPSRTMDGVDRDEGMLLDAASTATRSAGEKLRSVFERHDKRGRGKITVEAFEEALERLGVLRHHRARARDDSPLGARRTTTTFVDLRR